MSRFDCILVLPYVFSDHPSFPEGLLKRALEADGFTVGVISRPRWQTAEDFAALGKPGLFFAVVSGPLDSVVLNYTASGKRRQEDLYQPEGEAYFPGSPPSVSSRVRPDRTVTVFANRIREAFPGAPLLIGGVEASQRKFAHYDFQQKKIRRSILLDSRADLLVTGMGEQQIVAIARAVRAGAALGDLRLPGTAAVVRELPPGAVLLPAAEAVAAAPEQLLDAELALARAGGNPVAQGHAERYVLVQPPAVYNTEELDATYALPFTRLHPGGEALTPALQMNLFSVTAHRGCGGGCSFCSITEHEGRRIVSRSVDGILAELRSFPAHPRWKGIVSDIGGASAEMYGADCARPCGRASCLHPGGCGHFTDGEPYRQLLAAARALPEIRQVFLGSGLRYDVLLKNPALLEDVLRFHSGAFLRVAPEHTDTTVLHLMRKPDFSVFEEFLALFREVSKKLERSIALAPYWIIGYPGETEASVREMRERLRANRLEATDVQLFTPTPGTLATAMWVAGRDLDGRPLAVERDIKKLEARKALLTGG